MLVTGVSTRKHYALTVNDALYTMVYDRLLEFVNAKSGKIAVRATKEGLDLVKNPRGII